MSSKSGVFYNITSSKKVGKLTEYRIDYKSLENFRKFRKLLYTAKHKFLVKDDSSKQYTNSKRIMPETGDVCQIKELNGIIQNFRCLHIPQDLKEGTKLRFHYKNEDMDPKNNINGLSTKLIIVYNQVIGCLYPGEELDEEFIVQTINPTDLNIGNGCYIGWERPDPNNETGFIVLSNYPKEEFQKMLLDNLPNVQDEQIQ